MPGKSQSARKRVSMRPIAQLRSWAWSRYGQMVSDPPRAKPGHHQTMIQSLVHTIDLDRDDMLLLNTFRVKRNAIDYTGEDVDEASVDECIGAADRLLTRVSEWLAENKPELR